MTFSRVPLITAFMATAMTAEFRRSWLLAIVAFACMALAAFSDLLDGRLARRWKVVSTFGKLADPLMDKVFFIVTFPTLLWLIGMQGENRIHFAVMLAFTVLYILRDQWVTFLRAVASTYRADVSAMWLGKVRTALSFPAAGLIYAYIAFHSHLPASWDGPMLAAVYAMEAFLIVLNVYSCAVYTRVYWPYIVRAIGADSDDS
ncbi:MAG: CDP-alcohol phosphatidyltransferase family protein [Kiritimatiellae bacterium]|nr:CDP-alcohol phosphatidyltransferase family protein [Kiritimatiellia bacterium]